MRKLLYRDVTAYSKKIMRVAPSRLLGYWPLNDTGNNVALNLAPITTVDYMLNGNFETVGAGGADVFGSWSETAGDGTIADETSLVHGGSHACKLTSGTTKNTRIGQTFNVVPGGSYTLTFWSRGDGTNGGRYQVRDATNGVDLALTNIGVTGTTYTQVTYAFIAPSTCKLVTVNFYNPITASSASCYVDDVALNGPSNVIGRYTNITQLHTGIGDGLTSSFFVGSSAIDLYSSGLTNNFPTTQGTILCWGRILPTSSAWTDGHQHYLLRFKTVSSAPTNAVTFGKNVTNNQLFWQYVDTTVSRQNNLDVDPTNLDWFCMAETWQASGALAYFNGVQVGASMGVGTWSGAFDSNRCVIGSEIYNGAGSDNWSGWAAHAALWSTPLTAAQIQYLSKL